MNPRDHQTTRFGRGEPIVPAPFSALPDAWRVASVASVAIFSLILITPVQAQTARNATALMQQAQAGNASAELALGYDYEHGLNGLPKNPVESVKWYREAAAQGSPNAEFNLGNGYQVGKDGLPKNAVEAVKWYRKAAAQGSPGAENNLGFLYGHGEDGLTKSSAKAVYWFKKSAAQGYPKAEKTLGDDYDLGFNGLPKSPTKAVYWYERAAAQGFRPAIAALQWLQHPPQQAVATTPPAAAAPPTPVIRVPPADNQQKLQALQRFWALYFQASKAHVVDFGEPALVQPVSFGAKS